MGNKSFYYNVNNELICDGEDGVQKLQKLLGDNHSLTLTDEPKTDCSRLKDDGGNTSGVTVDEGEPPQRLSNF